MSCMLQIKNECGFRISDMWSAGKLERFYKLAWRQIWTEKSIRTGFFSSHSWAWTAIWSCVDNFQETIGYKLGVCFLFTPLQLLPYCMKFFSQGWAGGCFRGSTRRICCTSQDLHLHLHLFFFFCVRRIRTCNSWSQQIAGDERDAAAGGGGGGGGGRKL
jgi:hypothetical protein